MPEFVTFGETPLRLSPPGKERLETADTATIDADGTESNAAVTAQLLGVDSTWVSKLPDSPLGRRIVAELESHGIETEIAWADSTDTRQGLVFHESGHPPREALRWHDRNGSATATATPGDLPMDRIQSADVVFTGLSTPGLSRDAAETTKAMLRAAHGSGATTAIDVDYQPGFADPDFLKDVLLELFEHLEVLIANESKIRTVLDRSGKPRELANTIAADYDLETVVITRSQHGAVALQDTPGTNVIHERETVESAALDDSGQHGAFSGGFLGRLAEDDDLSAALSYGVAAATLARTVPGPLLTADRSEVERVVDDVIEKSG
ncbi:sugar kinase [Salinibaculum rarum]|uniref:sugar kinase n=1 Tax=Salinibaculum rarum TaxID=3058903 RepID=UPI00265FA0FA|nr:sugar kinase [Salinibaculum sp. KK48]